MSKYNKQLSIIDSESIATQPDSEGGVIWPDYTVLYQQEITHVSDYALEQCEIYINDPHFPKDVSITMDNTGNVLNYGNTGLPSDCYVCNLAVIGYSSNNFSDGLRVTINSSYPQIGVNLGYVVVIRFNKKPFA